MQDPRFNLIFVLIVVAALATVIIVLVRTSIRHQAKMERQAAARLKRIVDALERMAAEDE